MPNITQQSPYHDKLAQILSQQVLADFDNLADNFSVEETNEELILNLHLPKSFFSKQSREQQAIDEWANKAFGAVKISAENSPKGKLEDFNVADHIQLFDNMGE